MGTLAKRLRTKNPKLFLGVLHAAVDRATARQLHLSRRERDAFHRETLGREPPDIEVYDRKAERYLLDLDVDDARLARVRDLVTFGRPGETWVFALIGGFGEYGEAFAIDRLGGIEALSGLRSLDFGGMARGVSLAPLAKLERLETLSLNVADGMTDFGSLLTLPKLRTLSLTNLEPTKRHREVVEVAQTLVARGVAVLDLDGKAHPLARRAAAKPKRAPR
ncbi:MAG: hypothetical protein U0235_16365 [Polyangiaceae bacterium]